MPEVVKVAKNLFGQQLFRLQKKKDLSNGGHLRDIFTSM